YLDELLAPTRAKGCKSPSTFANIVHIDLQYYPAKRAGNDEDDVPWPSWPWPQEIALMREIWVTVASLPEVPEGGTLVVDVAGEAVCLYNLRGRIFATQNECTHAEASLAEGDIKGDCIECPLHQAMFHIPTGKVQR